jgi:antitoxin component of RelBE/YafQ-DinJ toxin-antitoxin module
MSMKTVHLKIRTNTNRGKYLLGLLREMAKTGRDIEFENIPNDETIEAIKNARAKKGMKAKNVDDLFTQLGK